MTVSIIIPVYNVEKYIDRCLRSVISQTYDHLECVVVNDRTPDRSFEKAKAVINDYQGNIKFKFVEHDRNKGLSEARNSGIRLSEGEYLYFLDSDDAIPFDSIENLVDVATKNNYPDVVYGRTIGIGVNDEYSLVDSPNLRSFCCNKDIFIGNLNNTWTRIACNKLIKRYIFFEKKTFFEPHIYHEDELWSFEISTYINTLFFCDKVTYHYYVGDANSISRGRPTKKHFEDNILILEKKTSYLSCILYQKQLAQNICKLAYTLYYSLLRNHFDKKYLRSCKVKLNSILNKISSIPHYKDSVPWYMRMVYKIL